MITLHHADANEVQITEPITAVITDPPYGCDNDCNYTRFTGGKKVSRHFHEGIKDDDKPFDPSRWLIYPKVILWGFQFFANKLPVGTTLVWNKRRENQLGKFLSDCELAWMKGGKGCYLLNHHWNGFDRASERGQKSLHPSQKPVALMEWCIDKLKLKAGDTVLDPFAGTGCVGLACQNRGLNYIGIEHNKKYYDIARQRLGI